MSAESESVREKIPEHIGRISPFCFTGFLAVGRPGRKILAEVGGILFANLFSDIFPAFIISGRIVELTVQTDFYRLAAVGAEGSAIDSFAVRQLGTAKITRSHASIVSLSALFATGLLNRSS